MSKYDDKAQAFLDEHDLRLRTMQRGDRCPGSWLHVPMIGRNGVFPFLHNPNARTIAGTVPAGPAEPRGEMMNTATYPPLSAYRVTLSDGSSYETNMAAGITLEEARAYFIGQRFEQPDETTILTAIAVEQID